MKSSKAKRAKPAKAVQAAKAGKRGKAATASKTSKAARQPADRAVARGGRSSLDAAERLYQVALVLLELAESRERSLADRERLANERDRAAARRDKAVAKREKAIARSSRLMDPAVDAITIETDGRPADPDLERARLEALLQRAHLDPLTGAFRREAGRLALRNEIDRARRSDGRFVLAFVDVDGLKEVNDAQGHAAGDHLLRTLVAIMRANLRSYDPVVRFGGDEFVCGIAAIDVEEARHRLDVIDQSMRHATGTGITAGLATLTSNETLDELTARADAALLDAKRRRA